MLKQSAKKLKKETPTYATPSNTDHKIVLMHFLKYTSSSLSHVLISVNALFTFDQPDNHGPDLHQFEFFSSASHQNAAELCSIYIYLLSN